MFIEFFMLTCTSFFSVQILEGGFVQREWENCHFNSRFVWKVNLVRTRSFFSPVKIWMCLPFPEDFVALSAELLTFFLKSFNETVRNSSSLRIIFQFFPKRNWILSHPDLNSSFFSLRNVLNYFVFLMSNVSHKAVSSWAFDSFPIETEKKLKLCPDMGCKRV